MTFNLMHALATALDDGCSLDELEATLLKGSDTDDRIAAAWLYAWAYDEIRPPHDDLAPRITSGIFHASESHPARRIRQSHPTLRQSGPLTHADSSRVIDPQDKHGGPVAGVSARRSRRSSQPDSA